MDVFTLSETFQPGDVIDGYEACVWTERYSSAGEFVLLLPDSQKNRLRLPEGGFLGLRGSRETMIIETRETENKMLKVSGPTLTKFLENRLARNTYVNSQTYWTVHGTPGQIAAYVVGQMCIAGGLMTNNLVVSGGSAETIDFLELGPTAPGVAVTVGMEYGDVYNTVKKLAETYEFGYLMYVTQLSATTYKLTFTSYSGQDRTSGQSINRVVQFSPAMDTLTNAKELRSIAGFKNVAYAWAPNIQSSSYYVGYAAAPGVTASTRNFKRRSMMVKADDINAADLADSGLSLKNILAQRARNALANNNYARMVNGEIVPQDGYEYGIDYSLGDLIELSTPNGGASVARVAEYIRSMDRTGYKAYPTLSVISE